MAKKQQDKRHPLGNIFGFLRAINLSIGTKIIVPYFLLTLIIAAAGTYVVTNLVASSLEERIQNQLIDAGRIVSEGIVRYEELRLQTLRAVVNTPQLATGTFDEDSITLGQFAPQLIINSNTDAVIFLNLDGREIYSWTQVPTSANEEGLERIGRSFAHIPAVQNTLTRLDDATGDNYVFVNDTPYGLMIYTTSPVLLGGSLVGVAMVGTYSRRMLVDLNLNAIAQVTLYDQNGRVLDTTLRGNQTANLLLTNGVSPQSGALYALLTETPARYEQVIQNIPGSVPIKSINIDNQNYKMAFGDWRLRDGSFGMFSVALPSNFIVATITTSRSQFVAVFTIAVLGVFVAGYFISQRITGPIRNLVDTAVAVTAGDLQRRANVGANDEIGELARSFNQMTQTLAKRNQELYAQSEELEAILHSITDGVVVLNNEDEMIRFNPAAKQLMSDMSHDFLNGPMREIALYEQEIAADARINAPVRRFQIGNRFLSASTAPLTDLDKEVGKVIILRDVTREVEADNLKSAFITSISHELRTPLTMIKVYTELLHGKEKQANELESPRQQFLTNILKGSQDLEHHINQLIRLTEIQAGTIQMNRKQLHFPDLIITIRDRWREQFDAKEITLTYELPAGDYWVIADANNLTWAIDNLLRNALTYTPQGGHVELCLQADEDFLKLGVLDNGIGIAAADQPYLFDRFFRANQNINFDIRGVGLGLYISKAIVQMHGGKISVDSELGVGSTFTITLNRVENGTERG